MATEIWVNIGSGNGILPDGTKPLPEYWHNISKVWWHLFVALSQEIHQPLVTKISLKIMYIEFNSNTPGANELNHNKRLTNYYD